MKPACWIAIAIATAGLPDAVRAQLIRDRPAGNTRICTYAGATGYTTGSDQTREFRVGLGENCPNFFPLVDNSRPAPPTAPLSTESAAGQPNVCIYRQWGGTWTYSPLAGRPCPPTAGMIPRQTDRQDQRR
jgi:hypothetical protein